MLLDYCLLGLSVGFVLWATHKAYNPPRQMQPVRVKRLR
jgi:hypothetical protein